MKSSTLSAWRYGLRAHLAAQLWLPVSLWLMFAILAATQPNDKALEIANSFMAAALPLTAGIMAVYALLDDPALELQFAAPQPAARMLLERAGGQLAIASLSAALFQVYCALIGLDFSAYGPLWLRQAYWLVPCLALTALGGALALLFTQTIPAVLLVSSLWLLQLLTRHWFIQHPIARYVFLFGGLFCPDHPQIRGMLVSLTCLSGLLLVAGWILLKRQERYI